MAATRTITCPHCSSTGSYRESFDYITEGAGQNTYQRSVKCKNCNKNFTVSFRDKQIEKVTK